MSRAKKSLTIWVGNTNEFKFRLKQDSATPLDLTGSVIVMSITHGGGRIDLTSADGGVITLDEPAGEITIPVSVALSRSIAKPVSGAIRYEIERRIDGQETTFLYGDIVLMGGDNAD